MTSIRQRSATFSATVSKGTLWVVLNVIFLSCIAATSPLGFSKDYQEYQLFYNLVDSDYSGRFEPAFVYCANLLKMIGAEFELFLLFLSFVALIPKLLILRNNNHRWFLLLLYVMLLFPLHEMTQIRLATSLGFGYYSIYLATIRRPVSAIICCTVAILFHFSSILFIPFVLAIRYFEIASFKTVLIMVFAPAIGMKFLTEFLVLINPLMPIYLGMGSQSFDDPNLFSIRNILLIILCLVGVSYLRRIPRYGLPWFYLSLAGVSVFYSVVTIPVLAHRIVEMTIFAYLIWVSLLPSPVRYSAMFGLILLGSYNLIRVLYIDPLFSVV